MSRSDIINVKWHHWLMFWRRMFQAVTDWKLDQGGRYLVCVGLTKSLLIRIYRIISIFINVTTTWYRNVIFKFYVNPCQPILIGEYPVQCAPALLRLEKMDIPYLGRSLTLDCDNVMRYASLPGPTDRSLHSRQVSVFTVCTYSTKVPFRRTVRGAAGVCELKISTWKFVIIFISHCHLTCVPIFGKKLILREKFLKRRKKWNFQSSNFQN